jgi:hypothetical protein
MVEGGLHRLRTGTRQPERIRVGVHGGCRTGAAALRVGERLRGRGMASHAGDRKRLERGDLR